MSRSLLILVVAVIVLVGGVVLLSTLDTEAPLTRIEKPVAADAAAR